MSNTERISASELERFGYCPLSWWLGRDVDVRSDELREGSREHDDISRSLKFVMSEEMGVRELRLSFIISAVMLANLIAVILLGVSDVAPEQKASALFAASLIWILIGAGLLFLYARYHRWGTYTFAEAGIMVLSTLMMLIALNTMILLQTDAFPDNLYLGMAMVWLLVSVAIQLAHRRVTGRILGARSGNAIDGEIVYVGDGGADDLFSASAGLSGRPDVIIRRGDELIPVEIKTGRVPRGPLFSHILQLGAYCVILNDIEQGRVERGILRYNQREFEIEYDDSLEGLVRMKAEEMRRMMVSGDVRRNHNRPAKCAGCSRRPFCPESLV